MKIFALSFFLALVWFGVARAIDVTQQEDGEVIMRLSAEEANVCAEEGGCVIITKKGILGMISRACGKSI